MIRSHITRLYLDEHFINKCCRFYSKRNELLNLFYEVSRSVNIDVQKVFKRFPELWNTSVHLEIHLDNLFWHRVQTTLNFKVRVCPALFIATHLKSVRHASSAGSQVFNTLCLIHRKWAQKANGIWKSGQTQLIACNFTRLLSCTWGCPLSSQTIVCRKDIPEQLSANIATTSQKPFDSKSFYMQILSSLKACGFGFLCCCVSLPFHLAKRLPAQVVRYFIVGPYWVLIIKGWKRELKVNEILCLIISTKLDRSWSFIP